MDNQEELKQEMARIYHQIAGQLLPELPEGWTKLCLGFFMDENKNDTMQIFVAKDDKEWHDFMEDVFASDDIMKGVFDCKDSCLELWDICEQHDSKWSSFTFVVDPEGKFNAYYNYEDLSQFNLDIKKQWLEKYTH